MTAKFAPLLLVPAALALTLPPNALNVVVGDGGGGGGTSKIMSSTGDLLTDAEIANMIGNANQLPSEYSETMDRLDIDIGDILTTKMKELTPTQVIQKLNPAQYASATPTTFTRESLLENIKNTLSRFPSLQKDEMIKRIRALGSQVDVSNTDSLRAVHKKYIEELKNIGTAGNEDLKLKFESAIGRFGLDTQMMKDIKAGNVGDLRTRIAETLNMVAGLDQRDMPAQIKALQDTVTNLQLDEKTHFTSLVTAMNTFMKGKSFSWFTWPSWGN